jgi:hypothetical protein
LENFICQCGGIIKGFSREFRGSKGGGVPLFLKRAAGGNRYKTGWRYRVLKR